MRISNNIMAINSHRQYSLNTSSISKTMEKLSSGFRVNRAADDAASLAISEKMRTQIRGMNQASRNALDAISMVQVAEGALANMGNIIQRIRELTVQGANTTNAQLDRNMIAVEIFQLSAEIAQMDTTVDFNTMKILDTRDANKDKSIRDMTFQVGPNEGDIMEMEVDMDALLLPTGYSNSTVSFVYQISSMLNHAALAMQGAYGNNHLAGSSYNYSGTAPIDIPWTPAYAGTLHAIPGYGTDGELWDQTTWISYMINQSDSALSNVSTLRATLGAVQNRLEFTIANLDNSAENLSASESRIRDADMAKMMTEFTKNNILIQASNMMLAQANAVPQSVLQLLG